MSQARRLGVVMDPIASINPKKDTTLAFLLEAQSQGWEIFYMEPQDLWLSEQTVLAATRALKVQDALDDWFDLAEKPVARPLSALDVTLMRLDPPFDMRYVYCTYLLEHAVRAGHLVVNAPQALRDCNEKLFIADFPQCCPPFLVSSAPAQLRAFALAHSAGVVLKPLDGMGGKSVFVTAAADPNFKVIVDTLTDNGRVPIMAQLYLPEVTEGDKRVFIIDGQPIGHMLARVPQSGEWRANLVVGGRAEPRPLGARERWICEQLGAELLRRGILFAGIDVIGDYLTEINITSPTGVRELADHEPIAARVLASIEKRLA